MSKNEQNGAIFRVHKTKNYSIMSNHHLKNKELPLKAKGLLSVILSLPPDWNYSVNGLAALSADGRDTILSTIKILKEFGYLDLEKERNSSGHFTTIYNVFEIPKAENPDEIKILTESEYPNRTNRIGQTESENPTNNKILNNEILNNKILNNKKTKKKVKKEKIVEPKKEFGEFKNVLLTEKEENKLRELYIEDEKFSAAIEILSSYKESSGRKYKRDYAVLTKNNWVFTKVYPQGIKKSNQAGEEIDYSSASKW